MIPTARRAWFATWFARQCRRRIRAAFGSLEVAGLSHLRDAAAAGPVVVVANHTSWWDPMLLLELAVSQSGLETFAMMDAENLRRLQFFALAGAFGVQLDSRRDGARAIRYGADLLTGPGRVVWVFPQGGERPAHEPLRFFGGAARMAELAQASVVPVGLRYAFGSTPRPRAIAAVGEPLPEAVKLSDAVTAQQDAVAARLAAIERHVGEASPEFEILHRASPGWLDAFLTGTLSRFAGAVLDSADEQATFAEHQGALSPAHPRGTESAGKSGQ